MCDGVRWRPITRRISDSRSRLTAGFATGVPCAQPGLHLENEMRSSLFSGRSPDLPRPLRGGELLEGPLAARPFLQCRSLGSGGERPPTDDHPGDGNSALCPLLGRQLPLPSSFLRQPEASGLPWSYDRLTPPNLWSHVSQRRLPSQKPNWSQQQPQSLSPTQCCNLLRSRSCVCSTLLPSTTGAFGMRGGPDIICVIVDGAHLLEHLGSLQCASAPAAFACLDILQIWQPQVCPGTLPYHPRTWSLHNRPGQNLPMRFWPAGARINPSPRPSRHQDPRNGRFFDTNRRDRGPSVTLLNTRMNYLVV